MFCENCGQEIPEDSRVCPYCGTRVSDAIPQQTGGTFTPYTGSTGGSKRKLIIPLAVVAAVCVVGGGVFAFANSPSKRFQRAEKKIIEEQVDNGMAVYDNYFKSDLSPDDIGFDCSADISIGDAGRQFLDIAEASGADLSGLDSIAVSASGGAKDNKAGGSAKLTINGKDSVTVIPYMDFSSDPEMLLYIPEITKDKHGIRSEELNNSLKQSLDSLTGSDASVDASPEDMKKLQDAMPSKKALKKELIKYATIIVKDMDDVDRRKTTISADGVSENVTELSVDIDGKMLEKISDDVTEAMEKDRDLREMYSTFADAYEETSDDAYMPEYDDFVDRLADSLENADEYDGHLTYSIYLRGLGTDAAGYSLKSGGEGISYKMPRHMGKWGLSYKYDIDDSPFELEGSGKGKDSSMSGELGIEADGYDDLVTITLDKFDLNSFKKGLPNGGVTLELGNDALDEMGSDAAAYLTNMKFGFDFKTKKHDMKVKLSLDNKSGNIATMNLKAEAGKAGNIEEPDADTYDNIDSQEGVLNYCRSLDLSTVRNILSDVGLDNYVSQIEEFENELQSYYGY